MEKTIELDIHELDRGFGVVGSENENDEPGDD